MAAWQQELVEVEEQFQHRQELEATPTEPAKRFQQLPTPQPAQRTAAGWLRSGQILSAQEAVQKQEQWEHEKAVRDWEQRMRQLHDRQPPPLPNNTLRPTSVSTEVNIHCAPHVRAALHANATEVPLKRPPPTSGRGVPKGFHSDGPPPMIGSVQPAPPPRPSPMGTCSPAAVSAGSHPAAQSTPVQQLTSSPAIDGTQVGKPEPKLPPLQIKQQIPPEPVSKQPRLKAYPGQDGAPPQAQVQQFHSAKEVHHNPSTTSFQTTSSSSARPHWCQDHLAL